MVCRFYHGYTLESIGKMTFKEYFVLNENMIKISELENPDPDKKQKNSKNSICNNGFMNKFDKKNKE